MENLLTGPSISQGRHGVRFVLIHGCQPERQSLKTGNASEKSPRTRARNKLGLIKVPNGSTIERSRSRFSSSQSSTNQVNSPALGSIETVGATNPTPREAEDSMMSKRICNTSTSWIYLINSTKSFNDAPCGRTCMLILLTAFVELFDSFLLLSPTFNSSSLISIRPAKSSSTASSSSITPRKSFLFHFVCGPP